MKQWVNALVFLILALVGFVMAALAARFQFSAVSLEGRGFWVVRTAPISAKDFLFAKAWVGFVPMLLVGECLAISSAAILNAKPFLFAIAIITTSPAEVWDKLCRRLGTHCTHTLATTPKVAIHLCEYHARHHWAVAGVARVPLRGAVGGTGSGK